MITWLFLFASLVLASNNRQMYQILDSAGAVLSRSPAAAKWHQIKTGDTVLEGDIVQVSVGATVSIRAVANRRVAGLQAESAIATIRTPTIFRVGADMQRKIRLSQFFLSQAPNLPKEKAKVTPGSLLFLDEAFERLSLVLNRYPAQPEVAATELAKLEKKGMDLALKSKPLRILSPKSNTIIMAYQLPIEQRIVWTPAKREAAVYKIYAWQIHDQKGEPRAITKNTSYTLNFEKSGSYYVQVMTTDGDWQSVAHAIHVVPSEFLSHNSKIETPTGADQPLVYEIDYPPVTFTQYTAEGKTTLDFIWRRVDPKLKGPDTLILTKVGGKPKRIPAMVTGIENIKLEPGVYNWYVETIQGKRKFYSDQRTITIERRNDAFTADVMRAALAPGSNGSFLFPEF
jgi:hypothetical protein